jgi:hypothetical protein
MKRILPVGLFSLVILLISSFQMRTMAQGAPHPGKKSIKEVTAAITSGQKTKVVANGLYMPAGEPDGQTQDKVPGASGTTFAITRLHAPSVASNGTAGLCIDPIRNGDSAKTLKKPGSGETGFIYELNNFLTIGQ